MTDQRSDILDDEFMRLTPGLRLFSVGILKLCRSLSLAVATVPKEGAPPPDKQALHREDIIVAWMLDTRNSLDKVKEVVNGPREILEGIIDEYEFAIRPDFLMRVRAEMKVTNAAVQAAAIEIERKPGDAQGPSPQGKS